MERKERNDGREKEGIMEYWNDGRGTGSLEFRVSSFELLCRVQRLEKWHGRAGKMMDE
jgi:hypothetical protein